MTDKRERDLSSGLFTLFVIAAIIVIGVLSVLAFTDNHTYTGVVTKLWTENEGIHGQSDYALVMTDDGTRLTVSLFTWEYGQLEVGVRCTFSVDHWYVAQSMTCDFGSKR